ncbi:MAG: redoxin domain-containing protein [Phycisphaerales bacterium]|nr:redoxin domain-containing protein [Phycisphaerales bacterium]
MRPKILTPALGICFLTAAAMGQPGTPKTAPGQKTPAGRQPAETAVTLRLGDEAPPLRIAKWVKGGPIDKFETGKVYAIEFWTTWCTPCHETFPLLNQIRQKHPEVEVIGISFTDAKGESIDKVIPFVEQAGDKMGFSVAFDDDRRTILAYMDASGYKDIPAAYVINQNGRVVWMGHPLDKMSEAIDQIVAGEYDLNAAIITAQRKTELLRRAKPYEDKLKEAYQKGDVRTAFELTDQLVKMDAQFFGTYAAVKFTMLLTKVKDYPEAYRYTQWLLSDAFKDNPQALNRMAWTILDDPGVEKRDYDMALKLARRANEIQKAKDPDIIDTLARAYFEKGDVDKAIEWQARALELARPDARTRMQETLDKYKARKAETGGKAPGGG